MEGQSIIEARRREVLEIGRRDRQFVLEELDLELALARLELGDLRALTVGLSPKCRKAQQEARARGSTNWQAPPPSVELGKPEPAPGHWRPADEMQTQTPV